MFSGYFGTKPVFDIVEMQTSDLAEASALHRARFRQSWNDGEFHALLVQDSVFGFSARGSRLPWRAGILGGFVLSRAAGGEAEILTIGVDLRFERQGLGWRLMMAAIREARNRDAEEIFLEVDEINTGAIGLYRRLGFIKVGERKAYYQTGGGSRSAALVMKLDLR